MIVLVYSVKAYFYSNVRKKSSFYFSNLRFIFTWKRNNDLFDDFEEFNLVDMFLELLHEFGIKVKPNLSLDLRIE